MIKKKVTKILVPLDGSKNSWKGLEMAISIARQFGATITGVYSIYAPPHTEFRGVGSVEKSLNKEVKKIHGGCKIACSAKWHCFQRKINARRYWI